MFVSVNDGYRDCFVKYGATKSAHKEGKAVDLNDPGMKLSGLITKELLLKHKLNREDNDYTGGPHTPLRADGTKKSPWCHLDTRDPYGRIFKP